MKALFGNNFNSSASLISNPFIKECITDIRISYYKGFISDDDNFVGKVIFKRENTKGEQNFEGSDLVDVFKQVYNFCNNL